MNYISIHGVLSNTQHGISHLNVTNGKTLYVAAENGNFTEDDVIKAEDDGTGVVLVEGVAGNVMHLRPRNDNRWLMFGGTFVYSSDARFPYPHPIKLMDRYEGNS